MRLIIVCLMISYGTFSDAADVFYGKRSRILGMQYIYCASEENGNITE